MSTATTNGRINKYHARESVSMARDGETFHLPGGTVWKEGSHWEWRTTTGLSGEAPTLRLALLALGYVPAGTPVYAR